MKTRKLRGYIENGQFKIGRTHRYMTKLERMRHFGRQKIQKGRAVA